jgi:ferrous iron transport protein B
MKRIALLGMPNTGKSTFFNRLTGAGARVGNWPGITVDLLAAKILLEGSMVEMVDLPGIYNFHGFSDDEQVVRHFLESQTINGLVVILNATQLDRQLALLLQLRALKLPMTLVLNMSDEAKQLGVKIDLAELARNLDMPVTLISAKYGQGFELARHTIEQILRHNPTARLADTEGLSQDDRIEVELDRIVSGAVSMPITLPPDITRRLDRILLHPWLGLPLFFITVFLLFQLIYGIGTPLQNGMNWGLELIKTSLLQPVLANAPLPLHSFIQDGLFDGVGTVLSFLPIIVVFFIFMAIIEDSGYLARAAYLMDAVMAKLGLDGRSFVMQLMGFGCNVPALMGTRVMRSRALRLLTMLVIPFSLCSARLQVFLFFSTAIFAPRAAAAVMFSLYLMSFLMAFLTALVWRGKYRSVEPLLLELPPYRFPTFKHLLVPGWQQSQYFLSRASGYIVGGVIVIWALTHYPFDVAPASPATLAGQLADYMAPIFQPLGIDRLLSVALLFGFIAKEIVIGALAVIYSAGQSNLAGIIAGKLDWVQAYSFMLFTLIYTPCLSTVAVLKQESKSWRFTALAVDWPLGMAWLVSFAFYQGARALGW